jgi:hypothetical protein
VVGGDVAERLAQGLPLVGGKAGADVLLVGSAGGVQLGHQFLALGGQVQGVQAAVGFVAVPADQPALFEGVDEATTSTRPAAR